MSSGESNRVLGVCTACGSAYAAREKSNGRILPIGARTGCSCGNDQFEAVDSEMTLAYDEDESIEP